MDAIPVASVSFSDTSDIDHIQLMRASQADNAHLLSFLEVSGTEGKTNSSSAEEGKTASSHGGKDLSAKTKAEEYAYRMKLFENHKSDFAALSELREKHHQERQKRQSRLNEIGQKLAEQKNSLHKLRTDLENHYRGAAGTKILSSSEGNTNSESEDGGKDSGNLNLGNLNSGNPSSKSPGSASGSAARSAGESRLSIHELKPHHQELFKDEARKTLSLQKQLTEAELELEEYSNVADVFAAVHDEERKTFLAHQEDFTTFKKEHEGMLAELWEESERLKKEQNERKEAYEKKLILAGNQKKDLGQDLRKPEEGRKEVKERESESKKSGKDHSVSHKLSDIKGKHHNIHSSEQLVKQKKQQKLEAEKEEQRKKRKAEAAKIKQRNAKMTKEWEKTKARALGNKGKEEERSNKGSPKMGEIMEEIHDGHIHSTVNGHIIGRTRSEWSPVSGGVSPVSGMSGGLSAAVEDLDGGKEDFGWKDADTHGKEDFGWKDVDTHGKEEDLDELEIQARRAEEEARKTISDARSISNPRRSSRERSSGRKSKRESSRERSIGKKSKRETTRRETPKRETPQRQTSKQEANAKHAPATNDAHAPAKDNAPGSPALSIASSLGSSNFAKLLKGEKPHGLFASDSDSDNSQKLSRSIERKDSKSLVRGTIPNGVNGSSGSPDAGDGAGSKEGSKDDSTSLGIFELGTMWSSRDVDSATKNEDADANKDIGSIADVSNASNTNADGADEASKADGNGDANTDANAASADDNANGNNPNPPSSGFCRASPAFFGSVCSPSGKGLTKKDIYGLDQDDAEEIRPLLGQNGEDAQEGYGASDISQLEKTAAERLKHAEEALLEAKRHEQVALHAEELARQIEAELSSISPKSSKRPLSPNSSKSPVSPSALSPQSSKSALSPSALSRETSQSPAVSPKSSKSVTLSPKSSKSAGVSPKSSRAASPKSSKSAGPSPTSRRRSRSPKGSKSAGSSPKTSKGMEVREFGIMIEFGCNYD